MKRALLLLTVLSGCSTPKVKVVDSTPPSEPIGKYSVLQLDLRCSEPDADEFLTQLRGALIAQLSERGLFKSYVTTADVDNADLRLTGVITGVRRVGTASRVLFGAMAGKAKMHIVVDLEDIKAQRNIAQFSVEGKSSGGSVAAGTTPEAVDIAAKGIAEYLLKHR